MNAVISSPPFQAAWGDVKQLANVFRCVVVCDEPKRALLDVLADVAINHRCHGSCRIGTGIFYFFSTWVKLYEIRCKRHHGGQALFAAPISAFEDRGRASRGRSVIPAVRFEGDEAGVTDGLEVRAVGEPDAGGEVRVEEGGPAVAGVPVLFLRGRLGDLVALRWREAIGER